MKKENAALNPTVPIVIPERYEACMLETMRRISREYHIHRFLVVYPSEEIRMGGYPDDALFERFGHRLAAMKQSLADTDIELGWWYAPTLNCGIKAPHIQHIVGANGVTSKVGVCPLDETFAEDFARRAAIVARIAHPFMIQFEDDYELSNHPLIGGDGCYCPLHLKAFTARTGIRATRASLVKMFRENKPETLSLREAFNDVCRQSLVDLAAKVRAAVDEVAPDIRMCQCEPGPTDLDGYLSKDVCQAFAGASTRPAIRLFGTIYCAQRIPHQLISSTRHLLYSVEHLPDHIEKFHETDTFPHNRFFQSAAHLRTLMYHVFTMGITNTLLYGMPYLDNPLDDPGYFEMYRDNEARFKALIHARQGFRLSGCYLPYAPRMAALSRKGMGPAAYTLAERLGFSTTTLPQKTAILSSEAVARYLSDEEIRSILSGGVLMDAGAAEVLQKRGFGKYLGIKVGNRRPIPVFSQRLCPQYAEKGVGIESYFYYAHILLGDGAWKGTRRISLNGAETVMEFRSQDDRFISPAVTQYTNELGGRVAVYASFLENNDTAAVLQLRMQKFFHKLMHFLNGGAFDAEIIDRPDIWCQSCKSADGKQLMVTLSNLSDDVQKDLPLCVAPEWEQASIRKLDAEGQWKAIQTGVKDGKLNLGTVGMMENIVLMFDKRK